MVFIFPSVMRDKDMQLEWNAPTQKHGELIGFRLRFGIQNQPLIEKILGPLETRFLIEDLGKESFCFSLFSTLDIVFTFVLNL